METENQQKNEEIMITLSHQNKSSKMMKWVSIIGISAIIIVLLGLAIASFMIDNVAPIPQPSPIEVASKEENTREEIAKIKRVTTFYISNCSTFLEKMGVQLVYITNNFVFTSSFSCSAEQSYNLTNKAQILAGTLDGGYNTITLNLTMDFSDYVKNPRYDPTSTQGPFHYGVIPILDGGIIKNLVVRGIATFKNINTQLTYFSVGGLVGSVASGTIKNCISYLKIKVENCTNSGINAYIGGLVGSTQSNSSFSAFDQTSGNLIIQDSAAFNKNNAIEINNVNFAHLYAGGIFGKAWIGCYNNPSYSFVSILNSAFFNISGTTTYYTNLGVFSSSLSFSSSCSTGSTIAAYDIFSTAGFSGITPSGYLGFANNEGLYKFCVSVYMQNNTVMDNANYGYYSYCPKNLTTTFPRQSPLWCQTNPSDLNTLGMRLQTGGTCYVSD